MEMPVPPVPPEHGAGGGLRHTGAAEATAVLLRTEHPGEAAPRHRLATICGVPRAAALFIGTCLCKANIYLPGLSKFTVRLSH